MLQYNARDILFWEEQKMWDHPDEDVIVIFDDGSIQMSWRQVIVSWVSWALIRSYPELPLIKDFSVNDETYPVFKRDAFNDINSKILMSVRETFGDNQINKEHLMKESIKMINHAHNTFWMNIQEYTTGADALDLIEITESPEWLEMLGKMKPTHPSINKAYAESSKYLKSATWKPLNPFVRAVREGNVNEHQTLQVTTARGFTMEIDSVQFHKPVMSSFAKGLHDIYELAVESRSASMAQVQATDPISDTEYFNRRLQLLNQTLRYLYKGDCGSTRYTPLEVTKSNFPRIRGMAYVDPTDDQSKVVTKKDKDRLIGKVIRLRSLMTCRHQHKYGICEACFGGFANSIPEHTSIGHTSAIAVGEKASQAVLSTKHLLRSLEVEAFELDDKDTKYLFVGGDHGNQIFLRRDMVNSDTHDIYLVLEASSVHYIKDAARSDTTINYSRLTRVEKAQIGFVPKDITDPDERDNNMELVTVQVSESSRHSFLTEEFAEHVLKTQYEMVSRKFVRIELSDWDFDLPVFELPLKRPMMSEFLKQFAALIETQLAKNKLDINTEEGLGEALRQANEVLETFINVPITYVTVLLASIMVRNKAEGDFRLPLPDGPREFASAKQIMYYRSLAPAMAYQEHERIFMSPRALTNRLRANHPFDAVIVPNAFDVYEDMKGSRRRG